MINKLYYVSSICFRKGLLDKRFSVRPIGQRQPNFDAYYDYNVIFADVFHDSNEQIIHAVGAGGGC